MAEVKESKEQLRQKELVVLKKEAEKEAWIALRQYFDGRGNSGDAKVACVIIATLAREEQAKNNKRQLDLLERKLLSTQ